MYYLSFLYKTVFGSVVSWPSDYIIIIERKGIFFGGINFVMGGSYCKVNLEEL